jgi:hypothetical protein
VSAAGVAPRRTLRSPRVGAFDACRLRLTRTIAERRPPERAASACIGGRRRVGEERRRCQYHPLPTVPTRRECRTYRWGRDVWRYSCRAKRRGSGCCEPGPYLPLSTLHGRPCERPRMNQILRDGHSSMNARMSHIIKATSLVVASVVGGLGWHRLTMFHGWPGSPLWLGAVIGADGEDAYDAMAGEMIIIVAAVLVVIWVGVSLIRSRRRASS